MSTDVDQRPDFHDGRRTRWDAHKMERRTHIIEASIELIREAAPGAEVHVREIAERAELSRTVIYRHFVDRADLDRAVKEEVLSRVWTALTVPVRGEGVLAEVITATVTGYIEWADQWPSLHALIDTDPADVTGPLRASLERVTARMTDLITPVLPPTDEGEIRGLVEPLVYGAVGAVFSSVRLNAKSNFAMSTPELATFVADSVWYVVQGHAARFGLSLDREARLEQVVATLGGTGSLPV